MIIFYLESLDIRERFKLFIVQKDMSFYCFNDSLMVLEVVEGQSFVVIVDNKSRIERRINEEIR